MVRYIIDLLPEDRDLLIGFLGICYREDLTFYVKAPPGTPGRLEAYEDADAEDDATERLTYDDDLTAGEILRYVRMIEELPPEVLEPEGLLEARDAVAQRIRRTVKEEKAAQQASHRAPQ